MVSVVQPRLRRRLSGFIAAALIVVTFVAAPSSSRSSGCLFCGARRVERSWLGIKTLDSIQENDCSAWVLSIHPNHSKHIWSMGGIISKGWFDSKSFGSGYGATSIMILHRFRSKLGEEQARALLAQCHAELARDDRESFKEFLKTEFNSLLTNSLPTTNETGRSTP